MKKKIPVSVKQSKEKVIKRVKPVKRQETFSKKILIGVGILIISLFIIVFFSSQPQSLQGNAAQSVTSNITPTFGAIGDCTTNHDCPSVSPSAGGQKITIVPGTTGAPTLAVNPTGGAGTNPCVAAKDIHISALSELHSESSSNQGGFLQLILQFFEMLLQLIEKLLGVGGTTTTPGGTTPTLGVSPSGTPVPSQTPCPPTSTPSGSQPTSNSEGGTPTSAPAPTTPVTSSSCTNPVWSSSDANGTWNSGVYEVQNDAWNGDHGPQTIYACSYNNFYALSNQTNTGGEVKTYPDTGEVFNDAKTVGAYTNIISTFAEAIQQQGEWDAAYDIWTNKWGNELMIWNDTHNHPEIPPSGSEAVTIDGVAYHVWQNGSTYTAFMRDTKVQSGSVNILDVFKWLESKGWMKTSDTLTAIEYGVEVSVSESSPGVQGQQKFPITNFSLIAN